MPNPPSPAASPRNKILRFERKQPPVLFSFEHRDFHRSHFSLTINSSRIKAKLMMGEKGLPGFEVIEEKYFPTSQQAIGQIKEWKDK